MGGKGAILINIIEVQEGALKEPYMPLLALIVEDFKWKDIDPIVEKASNKFLNDDIIRLMLIISPLVWIILN